MRTALSSCDDSATAGCGIAVMAKASLPGKTKTRLVPPLTFDEAAQCNTAFMRDIAENVLVAGAEASIAGYVAFGPPESRPFFRSNLPPEIELIEAWYPCLGDCLISTIAQLLQRRHRSAVVLNGDSPTLPTSVLIEAASVLEQPGDRMVLGPADDGGYYLLGLKANYPRLFQDIAWSTERVVGQTLDRTAELGLSVHLLPRWYDVDDVSSFKRLQAELFEGSDCTTSTRPTRPRHTHALIHSLFEHAHLRERLGLSRAFERAAE
jgi:uncharacterized protein